MDTEPVDPAVQAFEALRTEIAVLSAEITLALAEQRAIAAKPAPDYDLTLGRIANRQVTVCPCGRPQPSQRPPARPNRIARLSSGQSIG